MKIFFLAAATAAVALSTGAASAASHKQSTMAAMSPKEPIPYTQLDAYLKASSKERASKDWSSGAVTGATTDVSATARSEVRSAPDAKTDDAAKSPSTETPSTASTPK